MHHAVHLLLSSLLVSSIYSAQGFAANQKLASPKSKLTNISALPLKKLKSQTLTVNDPNESTMTKTSVNTYEAYDGLEVLNLAFGNTDWTQSKSLIFKCTDGYMPTFETKDFARGGFYFAFKREDSADFSIINNSKDNKKAMLAPYYLIWREKSMQIRTRAYYWPYQIVSVSYQ